MLFTIAWSARQRGAGAAASVVLWLGALSCSSAASAESRSYVVSGFNIAAYSRDGDCGADGKINPGPVDFLPDQLRAAGYTQAEISPLMSGFNQGVSSPEVTEAMVYRGRINGKPVNFYNYPESVPDPKIRTVTGRYAYGLNLDGKGTNDPNAFEDPETGEKGVDNEYFRVVGCMATERALEPKVGAGRPEDTTNSAYVWATARSYMPAWILTISADDLKQGPAKVTFEKSIDHVLLDSKGVMADKTFRIDPDARWHSEFDAVIHDGIITTTQAGRFNYPASGQGQFDVPLQFDLTGTRFRLTLLPDGTLDGVIGGYQPWMNLYAFYTTAGYRKEAMSGLNFAGMYYAFKRLADSDPDSNGHNRRISSAWRITAAPAFLVKPNGIATPVNISAASRD